MSERSIGVAAAGGGTVVVIPTRAPVTTEVVVSPPPVVRVVATVVAGAAEVVVGVVATVVSDAEAVSLPSPPPHPTSPMHIARVETNRPFRRQPSVVLSMALILVAPPRSPLKPLSGRGQGPRVPAVTAPRFLRAG